MPNRRLFSHLISAAHSLHTCKPRYSSSSPATSCQVRSTFLSYFADHDHNVIPSSSLIPHNDESLLFTNAGMVQFKNYFMNPSSAPFHSLTSSQRCVRAGGKHNDFETVGQSLKHQSFFEMLGNFSFGKYDNAIAIDLAWTFLTGILKLPVDRLKVSVLESDNTTYDIWVNRIGLQPSSIVRLGHKDNWWSMGDTGPCGPCTEIFWDNHEPANPLLWTEIWNIVFINHYQPTNSKPLEHLKVPCIDTGMGLERLCSLLNGSMDNYQTDLLAPLVNMARSLSGSSPSLDAVHHHIIADQFKCSMFLLSDGVIPSPTHRGYVLRKIIRRAVRSSSHIGLSSLTKLADTLLKIYPASQFPDIHDRMPSILEIFKNEESQARALISQTSSSIDRFISKQAGRTLSDPSNRIVPAKVVFDMYSSLGFPLDVIESVCIDRGWSIDSNQVQAYIDAHRNTSSCNPSKPTTTLHINSSQPNSTTLNPCHVKQVFVGYDTLCTSSTILAVDRLSQGNKQVVVISPNPFYALGGGQKPDSGILIINVPNDEDTKEPHPQVSIPCTAVPLDNETVGLVLTNSDIQVSCGDKVIAEVDQEFRHGVACHHSATHLLQWALRSLLGPKIVQAGSQVDRDRLTFDFSYSQALSNTQMSQVQALVNNQIVKNHQSVIAHQSRIKAVSEGALMLFTEKYDPNSVRSVKIGPSHELCCGTHVTRTHKMSPFLLVKERSIGSGIRRIEAVCGQSALHYIDQMQNTFRGLSAVLGHNVPDLVKQATHVHQTSMKLKGEHKAFVDQVAQYHLGTESLIRGSTSFDTVVQHIDSHLDLAYVNQRLNWAFLNRSRPGTWTSKLPVMADQSRLKLVVITYRAQITAILVGASVHDICARTWVDKIVGHLLQHLPTNPEIVLNGTPTMATARLALHDGPTSKQWEDAVQHICGGL